VSTIIFKTTRNALFRLSIWLCCLFAPAWCRVSKQVPCCFRQTKLSWRQMLRQICWYKGLWCPLLRPCPMGPHQPVGPRDRNHVNTALRPGCIGSRSGWTASSLTKEVPGRRPWPSTHTLSTDPISPNFYKMYRNDCRLLCWKQNCDLPNQVNVTNVDRRQIAANCGKNSAF